MVDPISVTLDHNCLVDLAERRPAFLALRKLIGADRSTLRIQVPGIGASERMRLGNRRDSFDTFQQFLIQLDLASADILRPMAYYDVTYWDWCVWADVAMQRAEKEIHEILFPMIEFDYTEFCARLGRDPNVLPAHPRWLNAKCDVQGLWCHIAAGGGIFVTRDRNFHKSTKKTRLERMGAGRIATPDEAVQELQL